MPVLGLSACHHPRLPALNVTTAALAHSALVQHGGHPRISLSLVSPPPLAAPTRIAGSTARRPRCARCRRNRTPQPPQVVGMRVAPSAQCRRRALGLGQVRSCHSLLSGTTILLSRRRGSTRDARKSAFGTGAAASTPKAGRTRLVDGRRMTLTGVQRRLEVRSSAGASPRRPAKLHLRAGGVTNVVIMTMRMIAE